MVVPSLFLMMRDVEVFLSDPLINLTMVLFSTITPLVSLFAWIVCRSVKLDLVTRNPVEKFSTLHPAIVVFCRPVMFMPISVPEPRIE